MLMQKTIVSVFILLLLFTMLAACSSYSSGTAGFYTGDTLTPEVVESIWIAISEREAEESEKYTPVTDDSGEAVLFWTSSGKVWHISGECSSLKRSTNINSGNIDEAEAAGKQRACSVCAKGAENK